MGSVHGDNQSSTLAHWFRIPDTRAPTIIPAGSNNRGINQYSRIPTLAGSRFEYDTYPGLFIKFSSRACAPANAAGQALDTVDAAL